MKNPRMTETARQERNRYAREWRAKNKDKVKMYNEAYWLRKATSFGGENNAKTDTD